MERRERGSSGGYPRARIEQCRCQWYLTRRNRYLSPQKPPWVLTLSNIPSKRSFRSRAVMRSAFLERACSCSIWRDPIYELRQYRGTKAHDRRLPILRLEFQSFVSAFFRFHQPQMHRRFDGVSHVILRFVTRDNGNAFFILVPAIDTDPDERPYAGFHALIGSSPRYFNGSQPSIVLTAEALAESDPFVASNLSRVHGGPSQLTFPEGNVPGLFRLHRRRVRAASQPTSRPDAGRHRTDRRAASIARSTRNGPLRRPATSPCQSAPSPIVRLLFARDSSAIQRVSL